MTNLFSENETNNICRACLENSDCLKPIYNSPLKDIFVNLTSLEILENDGYPSFLCKNCVERLQASNSFRELCIKSDTFLKARKIKKEDTWKELLTDKENNSYVNETIIDIKEEEHLKTEEESHHIEEDTFQSDGGSCHSDREDEIKNEEAEENSTNKQIFVPHSCQQCDENFPLLIALKKHIQKKHQSSVSKNRAITYLICPKCGKGFKKQDRLEAHLREHAGKKPEVCKECNAEFDLLRNLRQHMLTHGLRKFECLNCGKRFITKSKLSKHERIHLDIRPYSCNICEKSFHTGSHLKKHMISHSDEKPFDCESCEEKFKSLGSLKAHVFRRHTGVKNFICTLCGHKSIMKGDLKAHMRTHSQEKPYACMFCPKTFNQEHHLTLHIRTHTGERPYKCELCPMSFKAPIVLKDHIKTHTGERPHVCTVCDKAFIQKYSLKKHMETHNRSKVS